VERKGQFLDTARADRPDPIATWVLGSVGESLPSDLVLTNLTLLSETSQWRLTLSGQIQPNAVDAGREDARLLGRELGSLVTIRGIVTTDGRKAESGVFWLDVQSVEGVSVEPGVTIALAPHVVGWGEQDQGKGAPKLNDLTSRGTHYVKVNIEIPRCPTVGRPSKRRGGPLIS
jgi:hypothetical protein